jgi:hypothetical protein
MLCEAFFFPQQQLLYVAKQETVVYTVESVLSGHPGNYKMCVRCGQLAV